MFKNIVEMIRCIVTETEASSEAETSMNANVEHESEDEDDESMIEQAVTEDGEVREMTVFEQIISESGVRMVEGIESSTGRLTRDAIIVRDALVRVRGCDQEEKEAVLEELRAELNAGAPEYMFEDGEKGMWKDAMRTKIDVVDWAVRKGAGEEMDAPVNVGAETLPPSVTHSDI